MSALTITPASVATVASSDISRAYNAGASITAGQAVYLDRTTSTWKLADADALATLCAVEYPTDTGVALHAAASGQPLAVQISGTITIGATIVVGETYCVGLTAGDIVPIADLMAGDFVCYLGWAHVAGKLTLRPFNTGIAKAA